MSTKPSPAPEDRRHEWIRLGRRNAGRRGLDGDFTHTAWCVILIGSVSWLLGATLLSAPGMDPWVSDGVGRATLIGVLLGAMIGGLAGCFV